jgi:hypothetical protein
VFPAQRSQGALGVAAHAVAEAGEVHLDPAQAVVAAAQVQLHRALAERGGLGQVPVFDEVGLLLHEGKGITAEAGGRGEQQATVPGGFLEQGLDRLQAERCGVPHELGIVVARERRPPLGQGVAEGVHGELPHRAAGEDGGHEHGHGEGGKAERPAHRTSGIRPRQF